MKYIYISILIVISLTAVYFTCTFHLCKDAETNPVLKINDRLIDQKEFEMRKASWHGPDSQTEDFIDHLITRELMIQEAKRLGIDKEESFRQSIQNYYEQSLTKLLIDRKYESLNITVSDEEIKQYLSFMNKQFYLTEYRIKSPSDTFNIQSAQGVKREIPFTDLSIGVQYALLEAGQRKQTRPIPVDDGYAVFSVDRIVELDNNSEEIETQNRSNPIVQKVIREELIKYKKELAIEEWMEKLKKNATIEINLEG